MDAWLALLTKKVNPLRNHGLFKPIVIQLSLHLMDCLVMGVILMFKAEVMIWRKLKHTPFRWRTWSIEHSLQRPAQNPNRRLLPHSALFRHLPHLQWPTIDDSQKPRWKRQTTPLLRKLLEFDPGDRRPNRMIRWDQMGRLGLRWPGASFARLRSAGLWMRRTWSPTSRLWWAMRITPCWQRATYGTLARKMLVSWTACQTSHWGGWYAQGNLRPTSSLLGIHHWHLWTWSTGLHRHAGTLGSTSRRSRTSSHRAARRSGTTWSGVVGCRTSSRGLRILLIACSRGEPLAHASSSFPTQEMISLPPRLPRRSRQLQVLLPRERVDRREFTIRCTDLPGLRDLGRLSYDDFKFAKRVSGLLRGYDHKFLEPHHRHILPEFDDQPALPQLREHVQLLEEEIPSPAVQAGFVFDPEDTRSVHVSNWGGRCRGTDNLGHAVQNHPCEGLPRTWSIPDREGGNGAVGQADHLAWLPVHGGRSWKRTLPEGPDLPTPGGSQGRRRVSHHLPLHVVERSSADHLHRYFSGCIVM